MRGRNNRKAMTDEHEPATPDEMEIRCPRLGGPVTFGYCRVENVGKPCFRSITCWSGRFDVEGFFRQFLSDAEYNECFCKPPTPKMTSLVELIERAKKVSAKKHEES